MNGADVLSVRIIGLLDAVKIEGSKKMVKKSINCKKLIM